MATARKRIRRKSATSRVKRRRRVAGDQSFAPSVISGTKRRSRARKTYKPVKRHKRRSAIGGMGEMGNTVMGVLAGVVAGVVIDKAAEKFAPNMNPKIKLAVKAGAGVLLMMKGPKKLKNVGIGLTASAAMSAAREFGLIQGMDEFMSGIGAGSDTMTIEMNGVPQNAGNIMSGAEDNMPSVVSGENDGDGVSGTNMYMPSVIGS